MHREGQLLQQEAAWIRWSRDAQRGAAAAARSSMDQMEPRCTERGSCCSKKQHGSDGAAMHREGQLLQQEAAWIRWSRDAQRGAAAAARGGMDQMEPRCTERGSC